jgi:hypothetical protein
MPAMLFFIIAVFSNRRPLGGFGTLEMEGLKLWQPQRLGCGKSHTVLAASAVPE